MTEVPKAFHPRPRSVHDLLFAPGSRGVLIANSDTVHSERSERDHSGYGPLLYCSSLKRKRCCTSCRTVCPPRFAGRNRASASAVRTDSVKRGWSLPRRP